KEAQKYEEEDKRLRELIEAKNNADSLIYQTKKLMEENKDKILDNEKQQIEAAIKSLEEDIKTDDIQRIKLGIENLQKSMYSFSQRIYTQQAQQQAYQQAADQAQKAAGGTGTGAQGATGSGGASYKSNVSDKDKDKKVVDVEWESDED
ncbi:MAG: Hsp70 family protein, partial [Promethearchaeota archaeon]